MSAGDTLSGHALIRSASREVKLGPSIPLTCVEPRGPGI